MTGLRFHRRDRHLPAQAGDADLCPPGEDELLSLVEEALLRPGRPSPVGATLVYARWKPGTSVCAAYELETPGEAAELVVLKRYRGDKADRLAEREAPADDGTDEGALAPSVILPGRGLHLWRELDDRELPGLARLGDMRRTRRLLSEQGVFAPWRLRSHRSGLTRLRYRPERRAVLRLDAVLVHGDEPRREARLAVRALPPDVAARVVERRRELGALPFAPRLVADEVRTGLLFETWLDDLSPVPATQLVERMGTLLARLHDRARPRSVSRRRPSPVEPLLAWHPALARRLTALPSPDPVIPEAPCWIHGDAHADQFAAAPGDEPTVLLDLDALRPGDAHEDLASVIADGLSQPGRPSWDVAAGPLLESYRRAGGRDVEPDLLRDEVADALVQRAAAGMRRLAVDAVTHATLALETAEALRRGRAVGR